MKQILRVLLVLVLLGGAFYLITHPSPSLVEQGRDYVAMPVVEPSSSLGQKKFGYISGVESSGNNEVIIFDEAEWFNEPEASIESRRDHGCDSNPTWPECSVESFTPNGFYIRNVSSETTKLTLTSSTEYGIIKSFEITQPVPFEEFKQNVIEDGTGHYWVTVADGRVTLVEEQYVP